MELEASCSSASNLAPQLRVGRLQREICGLQSLLVVASLKFDAGAGGYELENLEVRIAPVTLAPIQDCEVPAHFAVFVAERYGKKALRAKLRQSFSIQGKHLLDVSRKGDYLVVQHALTRRPRE